MKKKISYGLFYFNLILTISFSTLSTPKKSETFWYALPLFSILALLVSTTFWGHTKKIRINLIDWIFIFLIGYLIVTDINQDKVFAENFRLMSLLCGICYYWICRLQSPRQTIFCLFSFIFILAIFQICVSFYHIFKGGLLQTEIKGLFLHSGYNAQLISLSCPVFLFYILKSNFNKFKLVFVSIYYVTVIILIIFLGSRVAMISLFLGTIIIIIPSLNRKVLVCLLIGSIVIFIAASILYKFTSTSGRVLVWTCCVLNTDKFFPFGCGTSSFSVLYPQWQANYFNRNPNSKFYYNATDIQYPFNEWILWVVEHGIFWILAMIYVVGTCITKIESKSFSSLRALKSILIIIVLQSLVSNIFQTSFFVVLFYSTIGVLSSHLESPQIKLPGNIFKGIKFLIATTLFVLFISLVNFTISFSMACIKWQGCGSDIETYRKIETVLNMHAGFSYEYALVQFKDDDFNSSLNTVNRTRNIADSYDLEILKGLNFMMMNRYDSAKRQFLECADYIPHRLYPIYLLMMTEDKLGTPVKAKEYAQKLLFMKPKIESILVNDFKAQAKYILSH